MKIFDTILFYVCFISFITSCSIGIVKDNERINYLGMFFFFVSMLIGGCKKDD